MTKFQKKVFSTLATSALLLNSFVGAVFAETTTLTITGNGADSTNSTNVGVTSTTTVVQTNTADISNNVDASSSTGGNDANKNTGGDVTVKTGDASTGVSIDNTANSNVAQVSGCCAVDANVEISGNGADSDNSANLGLSTSTEVYQDNYANLRNTVYADSSSGDNDANKNTGGDVTVWTGDASTTVLLDNKANSNIARVGGGDGNGSVSLKILGNGADSDNSINLGFDRSLVLTQDNLANIKNKVNADADTGYNDANENTGGNVTVKTGDATTGVGIDNMANFNAADLDCGCLVDVLAKIAGNGADSDNSISAGLSDTKEAFQTNDYSCDYHGLPGLFDFGFWGGDSHKGCNDVNASADTGANDLKETTSWTGGDPMIETGDAATLTEVSTTANSNVLNDGGTGFEMPSFDFNFDFGSSNWLMWMGWLMGHSS